MGGISQCSATEPPLVECRVCLGEHDPAFHESTLRIRAWLLDRVTVRPVAVPARPAQATSGFGATAGAKLLRSPQARRKAQQMTAVLANRVEPLLAEEAKQRQREHGGTAPGKSKTPSLSGGSVSQGKAAHFAAKLVGVKKLKAASR